MGRGGLALLGAAASVLLALSASAQPPPEAMPTQRGAGLPAEQPYLVVLGIAQDGGVPQTGDAAHPGWTDPTRRRRVVSLGLVDPASGQRWLFEATPHLPEQLAHLDRVAPVETARTATASCCSPTTTGRWPTRSPLFSSRPMSGRGWGKTPRFV